MFSSTAGSGLKALISVAAVALPAAGFVVGVLGAATLRGVSGATVRALGEIEVKGRQQPLDAYVLEALAPG